MSTDSDALVARLIDVAVDVFGVPAGAVTADSSSDSVESWDSISHLNLMLAVEQAFGVRIDPEQMVELTSIRRIAEAIGKVQPR